MTARTGRIFQSSLLTAASKNDVGLLEMALRGECGELEEDELNEALTRACWQGSLECARILLDRGADIDAEDMDGCTPLILAATNNNYYITKLLLSQGCDIDYESGDEGRTALHGAVWGNWATIVRVLILAKCDVNIPDNCGITPLMLAVRNGNADITKQLLRAECDVNARDREKDTALHFASRDGHKQCAQLLIKYDSDVNAKNIWSLTPLLLAVTNGNPSTAACLIENGADVNAKDRSNKSVLFHAVTSNMASTVRDLLAHDACPHVANNDGNTPIIEAVFNNQKDIVLALITANCTVNVMARYTVKDVYSWYSPLEIAIMKHRNIEMASILINAGHSTTPLWTRLADHSFTEDIYSDVTLLDTLTELLSTPLSLREISCNVIRRYFGYTLQEGVDKLPLPQSVKNYILYL